MNPILKFVLSILTVVLTNCATDALASNVGPIQLREELVLNRILNSTVYNARMRPIENATEEHSTTKVVVNLYVMSIQAIDDINMGYKMQIQFCMKWRDSRLAYDNLPDIDSKGIHYLTLAASNWKIWTPDLYFWNEVEGHMHNILVPNTYSRIVPDGSVYLNIRLSLTLSCPMDMKMFPFDEQICSIRMGSYGYVYDELRFLWKRYDNVGVPLELHLPKFSLRSLSTHYCDSHLASGDYSCLRVDFAFQREFRHYIVKMFIPMAMLLVVAYLALWAGKSDLTISLTVLMVMILGSMATEGSRPAVSYTTAMDIWIGWCMVFSFSVFLFCVIYKFMGGHTSPQRQEPSEDIELRPIWTTVRITAQSYAGLPLRNKMLFVLRIVYPIAFLIFVTSYATFYSFSNVRSASESDDSTSEVESQPGKVTRKFQW